MIDILNRWTRAVIYHSETAQTIAEAVVEAKSRANLSPANLSGADLSRANLSRANLSGADLYSANLSRANLSGANLSGADLSGADLSRADLSRANLSRANLSGADLYSANLSRANLSGADLSGADLSRADLYSANLSGANLSGADLYSANLSRANLSRANLSGADLYSANLSGADGVNRFLTTPLYLFRDQPGKIRAYKLVNAGCEGPYSRAQGYGAIAYEIGQSYSAEANTDESIQCASGISLATLDWCMKNWQSGYRILIAEFEAADIAAIPIGSDGKFRVHRCSIVGEKGLAEIGLVETAEVSQ